MSEACVRPFTEPANLVSYETTPTDLIKAPGSLRARENRFKRLRDPSSSLLIECCFYSPAHLAICTFAYACRRLICANDSAVPYALAWCVMPRCMTAISRLAEAGELRAARDAILGTSTLPSRAPDLMISGERHSIVKERFSTYALVKNCQYFALYFYHLCFQSSAAHPQPYATEVVHSDKSQIAGMCVTADFLQLRKRLNSSNRDISSITAV